LANGGGISFYSNHNFSQILFEKASKIKEDSFLRAEKNDLESLLFPSLDSIAGTLDCDDNSISKLDFSSLHFLSGNVTLQNNNLSSTLNFPTLTEHSGQLVISNNSGLMEILFPSLRLTKGGITISDNPDLKRVDFSSLERMESPILIKNNPQLENIVFEFKKIQFDLELDNNTSLQNLNLSNLAILNGRLILENNIGLKVIDLRQWIITFLDLEIKVSNSPNLEMIDIGCLYCLNSYKDKFQFNVDQGDWVFKKRESMGCDVKSVTKNNTRSFPFPNPGRPERPGKDPNCTASSLPVKLECVFQDQTWPFMEREAKACLFGDCS